MDLRERYKDFPILGQEIRGKRFVYLDSAATSQKPQTVIDAIREYYERYNANIHRGAYYISEKATAKYEGTRAKIQRFINATSPQEIIYTRGTTEAINLVTNGWGKKFLKSGDEILLTEMEHHSNIVPWQLVAKATGAVLRFIPVSIEDGKLVNIESCFTPKTRIVSVVHVSNVVGTINPVGELAKLAHENGALIMVDGAQASPHVKIDVQALDVDFYAFSSHKVYGPTGLGVLYAKKEHLEQMDPFLGGGDMIREVFLDHATWNDVPYKFEAGTMPIVEVIGLGVALDYLQELGIENVRNYEEELTGYLLQKISGLGDATIYGPRKHTERGALVAFNLADIHPHDIATAIDQYGVAIRAGHHCAQPLMRKFDVAATARASFGVYNRKEDVDVFIESLDKVRKYFSEKQ